MPNGDGNGRRRGLSRRGLLKSGAAAGALGALGLAENAAGAKKKRKKRSPVGGAGKAVTPAETAAPPLPEIVGPGPVTVRLRVNGEFRDLSIEPRTTLLEVLRDRLGLYGTKEVCDRGACGACTVLLDGKPVYACGLLAIAAHRRQVSTIEGVARLRGGVKLHPLIEAVVAAGAVRCGFCTPGFVLAARALLDRNAAPTPGEVDAALSGNLCRCGCYPALRRAVLDAAPHASALGEEAEGQDPPKPDGGEGEVLPPAETVPPSRRSLLTGGRLG